MIILSVPVTAVYASLLVFLHLYLALRVVRARRRNRVGLGDGGNKEVLHAMRVQTNAIENIPLFLILLLVFELNGGAVWLIHSLGLAFLASRLLHLWGFGRRYGTSFGRYWGAVGTFVVLTALAIVNIVWLI